MSTKKNAAAASLAAVSLAGGLLAAAPAASAAPCDGQSVSVSVTDPATGDKRQGTATSCTEAGQIGSVIGFVTPAVGVDFRDDNGNRTTSGLSPRDQFKYLGQRKVGINGDGTLIKVRQITQGMGGWGDLYEGWIPEKYVPAGLID